MTAICCNQCFESIVQRAPVAGKIWLDLCNSSVENDGILSLRETRVPWCIPAFRLLEKLGYITTADGLEAIRIRVEGYDVIEDEINGMCLETFCIDRDGHSSRWV